MVKQANEEQRWSTSLSHQGQSAVLYNLSSRTLSCYPIFIMSALQLCMHTHVRHVPRSKHWDRWGEQAAAEEYIRASTVERSPAAFYVQSMSKRLYESIFTHYKFYHYIY